MIEIINHVLFDFDGTMVDSRYLVVDLFNETAAKYGYRKIKHSEYEALRTLSIIERCKAVRMPVYLIPVVMLDLTQRYRRSASLLKLVDGVGHVIKTIKKSGCKLSILSSNTKENINAFLKANQIGAFDGIYSTNNALKKEKAIRDFILTNGLNPQDIIYVGDEVRDIVACKGNDVRIISVTWGYDARELLQRAKPDYLIDKPAEILNIVK